jgi:hypothetical protein
MSVANVRVLRVTFATETPIKIQGRQFSHKSQEFRAAGTDVDALSLQHSACRCQKGLA